MPIEQRLGWYERSLFKETLLPLVQREATAAHAVLEIARKAAGKFSVVDMIELDDCEATSLRSSMKCWLVLEFLLDNTVFSAAHADISLTPSSFLD